jgi:hypothetical protein
MSERVRKEKEKVVEPIEKDFLDSDISNTSGNACICKGKRNIACKLHGG